MLLFRSKLYACKRNGNRVNITIDSQHKDVLPSVIRIEKGTWNRVASTRCQQQQLQQQDAAAQDSHRRPRAQLGESSSTSHLKIRSEAHDNELYRDVIL